MNKLIRYILALPKTIYVNLCLFEIRDAIRLPVIVSGNTIIGKLHKGAIKLQKKSFRAVQIGMYDGSFSLGRARVNYLNFHSEGTLHVADTAKFSNGCSINIGGNVHLGKNFTCNAGFVLSAENKVSIGDDCLFGWNVNILDGDGHDILIDKKKVNTSRPIHIGNHCWICSNVTILKGTFLENESVVGTGTIVSKSFENNGNVLISGNPARVSKNEIEWKA